LFNLEVNFGKTSRRHPFPENHYSICVGRLPGIMT